MPFIIPGADPLAFMVVVDQYSVHTNMSKIHSTSAAVVGNLDKDSDVCDSRPG